MPATATPALTACHITQDADGFTVTPEWGGVDRPTVGGWLVNTRALAERLSAAVLAGVVCVDAKVAADVNGKTYVSSRSTVLGRQANADLKRLGF